MLKNYYSLKDLREKKDEIKENTMRRIDSMGFKIPKMYK